MTIDNEFAGLSSEALRLSIRRKTKMLNTYNDIDDDGTAITWLAQFGYSISTLMAELEANEAAMHRMQFLLKCQSKPTVWKD